MPSPLARALAAVLCCLPLALPAAAQADLGLTHVQTESVETEGNGDNVVGPGDEVRIDETVRTAAAMTGATGTIFSPTPGVSIQAGTSAFTDAAAGGQSRNVRGFRAVLASDMTCGANLNFTLTMTASGGQDGSVNFRVPTGGTGPLRSHDPIGLPEGVPEGGAANLAVTVGDVGRVKAMEVRIGSITHPRLDDLRLVLVAPDGFQVVLADPGDLAGGVMTDAIFAADGDSVAGATAPYTGRYKPRGDLGDLEGRVLDGTWTLRVQDTGSGATGTVDNWGLKAARAFCSGIPKAVFTTDPPVVSPGGTVQFDGSASSDSGGAIVSYEWDLDGDGQFDDGTTPQVERTYPTRTSVLVKLRVTDDDGLTGVRSYRLPVTERPTARLVPSPASPLTGETVRLGGGTSSDPDPGGSIVRYQWVVEGQDPSDYDTQGTPYLDVAFATPGTKSVTLIVTDDDGAQDVAQVAVVVRNRPPAAAIADPGLTLRDRVTTLSAAGSTDPDGTIVDYAWDLDGNGVHETSSGASPTIDHTFAAAGPATVGVQITDDSGATATATRSLVVTRAPVVTVTATPSPVSLRRSVTFDASGSSDPDDPAAALGYEWDLENDGIYEAPGAATRTTSWATAGLRTVKVRVTDPSGAKTVGSVDVLVRNVVPIAAIAATPAAPTAGQPTQLSAAGSVDADGTIVRYQWDLDGDGAFEQDTGTTPSTSTTFANHGNLTVAVRLTDDDGGVGTKSLTIGVVRPPDATVPPGVTPVQPATTSPGTTPGTTP
ncbi:MAG TPA: PKD domain-containing protein, partial [Solirubrobacteraceae bacterium]|nr:PKD domain-containing protein [Solirubrobacteraceae bacterium]